MKFQTSIVIAIIVIVQNGNCLTISKNQSDNINVNQHVFNSVPEEDRQHFITYHLKNAIQLSNRTDVKLHPNGIEIPTELHRQFEETKVPSNFSLNLLRWAEQEAPRIASQSSLPQHKNTNTVVCFPWGCIDVGDIGSLCCPF